MTKPTLAEYEALGIHEDTMACVAIVSKREAKEAVWALASNGIGAEVARDAGGKAWHVAVRGSFGYNAAAYFALLRGESVRTCLGAHAGQHPIEIADADAR